MVPSNGIAGMSESSNEACTAASVSSSASDSTNCQNGFWEVGAYRANVERIRDGAALLDEITKAVKERIDIENKYGKSLQSWNRKWSAYTAQQGPDNCIKQALEAVALESKEMSRLHLHLKDRFTDEIVKTIELFKRENYHRSAIRGFREVKETEDDFEKAQRHWKKLFERLEATKKHYHHCCRAERSAHIQWMNSHSDSSLSRDGADKTRDRYEKAAVDTQKAKTAYEQQLREIRQYNNVYVENMAFVIEKCQQMELKRMKFVVEMVSGMQKILVDLVQPSKLSKVHEELDQKISALDESQLYADLKKWSLIYGTDAPTKWPCFEEYAPEMRPITNNHSAKPTVGRRDSGGVVLTKKVDRSEDVHLTKTQQRRSSVHIDSADLGGFYTNGVHGSIGSGRDGVSNSMDDVSVPVLQSKILNGMHTNEASNHIGCSNKVSNASTAKASSNGHIAAHPTPLSSNTNTISSGGSDSSNAGGIRSCKFANNKPPSYDSIQSRSGNKAGVANCEAGPRETINRDNLNIRLPSEDCVMKASSIEKVNDLPSPVVIQPSAVRGMARVLYDYGPMESDEIPLIKGEYLDVLDGPDHLGWCYGRKPTSKGRGKLGDGVVVEGLFPASYVEKI